MFDNCAGGYYGYARCALGSTLGYIVGCSAVLENIFFVSSAILRISQSFLYVFQIPKDFAYLCWFAVYFMIITIHARHKYLFWRMMHILTVLSYSLFLIYLLGTSQYLNFDKYAYQSHAPDQFFEGGFLMWFENFRLPSIFFFGIDMIICVSDQVHDPRNNICKAMISCFLCMVVFSIWFIVTLSSQAPGLTKDLFNPAYPFPLGYGLGRLFNISMQSSALYAILPLFSSVLTTIFVCSKQINSIANSGMFPSLFKTKAQGNSLLDPQILAMIFAGVIGCVGNTVAWNYDLTMTLRLILLSGFVVYIAMLLCYIVFAHKYGHIDRSFRSPFGSIGAVLGIIIFVFALASLLYSQKNNYAVYIYVSCMVLMFVYYIIFGEANQVFSSMEIQYFFRLYVVNGKFCFSNLY